MTRYAVSEGGSGRAVKRTTWRSGARARATPGVVALLAAALLLVLILPGSSTAQAQIDSQTVYYSDETGSFPHPSWGPVFCDPGDTGSALNVTPGSSAIELNHTLNFFSCWSSGPFAGPIPAGTWTVDLWLHTYAGIGSNNQIGYELWVIDSDDPTAFPAGVRCVTGGVFDCDPTIGQENFTVTNTAPQEYETSFSVPAVPFDNFHLVSYLFPGGEINRTFNFTYNGPPGSTGDSRWTRPILPGPALAPDFFALGAALIVIVTAMAFFNIALKEERKIEDVFFLLILVAIVVIALSAWLGSR